MNPNGRFRTLDGIYAVRTGDGEPVMTLGEGTAHVTVMWRGEEHTLQCLLRNDEIRRTALEEVALYTERIECPYLVPQSFHAQELLVFDTADRPVRVDVTLQRAPRGQRLDAWLAEVAGRGDAEAVHALAGAVADVAQWLAANDFGHGRVSARSIYVTAENGLVLTDYRRASRRRSPDDLAALGSLAAALYAVACQPEIYGEIVRDNLLKMSRLHKFASVIADIMDGEEDAAQLKELLTAVAQSNGTGEELCRAMRGLASTPVRNYRSLGEIAARAGQRGGGETSAANIAEKYIFMGRVQDGVMRALDSNGWIYIDRHGCQAIPGRFVGADDFAEGRASVETEEGHGLIDRDGRFVIGPQHEDVEWDSVHNVAIVTSGGLSGLYSRDGEPLTGFIYDHILSGNEGMFPVRCGMKYGYLNRDGRMVIRPQYDDAFGFRDGMARVRSANRELVIDPSGHCIDVIQTQASERAAAMRDDMVAMAEAVAAAAAVEREVDNALRSAYKPTPVS